MENQKFQSYQKANVGKKQRKSAIRRQQRIADLIKSTDLVLDIGAYTNSQLKYLKLDDQSQYFPLDINKFTKETIVADISTEKLPFEDNHFDKIIFSMVLEHLDEPKAALFEINRVLKKEGELILVVPNAENLIKNFQSIFFEKKFTRQTRPPEHCLAFGTEEICNLLKRSSFKVKLFEKRSPEIVQFKLLLPEWRIFKFMASDILVLANK